MVHRLLLLLLCASPLFSAGGHGGHAPMAPFLLQFALILAAAKLGGEVFERIGQPAVLGELLAGVVIGNLHLAGVQLGRAISSSELIVLVGELGVILLLFEVGLESKLDDLTEVGISATVVATAGVIAPVALGYGVSKLFLPGEPWYAHLFAGATLAATSVGITARVLRDLGRTNTKEARIILGAAVVDDVLGLVILGVVSALVTSVALSGVAMVEAGPVLLIVGKAVVFLAGAIFIGRYTHVNLARFGNRFRTPGVALTVAACHCFVLSGLAALAGLAPIVGAFAAGLVLEETHYEGFFKRGELPIHQLVRPVATLFVPVFFVLMGMRVQLQAFTHTEVLGFAAALSAAAIVGKQVCGLCVFERGLNRLAIGVGMIPRGEVGLIFIGIGAGMTVAGKPVFPEGTVTALVVMVMVTTLLTPPLLRLAFLRNRSNQN
jgi:Kef-type K+ transport system membrane component KefB